MVVAGRAMGHNAVRSLGALPSNPEPSLLLNPPACHNPRLDTGLLAKWLKQPVYQMLRLFVQAGALFFCVLNCPVQFVHSWVHFHF